jgi:hypothetical protein
MRYKKRIVLLFLTLLLTSCGNQTQVKNSSLDIDSNSESKLNEITPSEPQGFMETWNQQLSNEGLDELNKLEKTVDEFNKQVFLNDISETGSMPTDVKNSKFIYIVPSINACEPKCESINPSIEIALIHLASASNGVISPNSLFFKIQDETLEVKSFKDNRLDFLDTPIGKRYVESITFYISNDSDVNFFAQLFSNTNLEVKVYGDRGTYDETLTSKEVESLKKILIVYRYLVKEDIQSL